MPSSHTVNENRSQDEGFENLLTEREVSAILRMSTAALRRWRVLGSGPPYLKIGGAVRYNARTLRHWIATRRGGGDPNQAGDQ
jgi:Helix-turn-helix domain